MTLDRAVGDDIQAILTANNLTPYWVGPGLMTDSEPATGVHDRISPPAIRAADVALCQEGVHLYFPFTGVAGWLSWGDVASIEPRGSDGIVAWFQLVARAQADFDGCDLGVAAQAGPNFADAASRCI